MKTVFHLLMEMLVECSSWMLANHENRPVFYHTTVYIYLKQASVYNENSCFVIFKHIYPIYSLASALKPLINNCRFLIQQLECRIIPMYCPTIRIEDIESL